MAPLNAAPRAVSKTSLGLLVGPLDAELRATTCFGFVIYRVPFIWVLLF